MTESIIYTRYSPRKNETEVNSGKQQADACIEYCEYKGYEVIEIVKDELVSGDEIDRPELWRAINSLNCNRILVCFKLDRLARDVCLSEVFRREIRNKGSRVEFVKDDFCNGDSAESILVRQIFQAFAEYEKKVIAMRTKYALLHQQKSGKRVTREDRIPYGWQLDKDGKRHKDSKKYLYVKKHEAEQEILSLIIRLRHEGYGCMKIANYLNKENHKPRHADNWSSATIYNILKREGLIDKTKKIKRRKRGQEILDHFNK